MKIYNPTIKLNLAHGLACISHVYVIMRLIRKWVKFLLPVTVCLLWVIYNTFQYQDYTASDGIMIDGLEVFKFIL
jgi:hypothetical protein